LFLKEEMVSYCCNEKSEAIVYTCKSPKRIICNWRP